MALISNNEMLDELAVECMDLQVALGEVTNISRKKDLIKKSIEKSTKRFQRIPEFEEGFLHKIDDLC